MQTRHLSITLLFDGAKWVTLFERQDEDGYSVCELFCGVSEPVLADLYQMLLSSYRTLVFSQPLADDDAQEFEPAKLNFKRMQRESRRLLENSNAFISVREATRVERLQQKAAKDAEAKAAREAHEARKFQIKQERKKAKQRGH